MQYQVNQQKQNSLKMQIAEDFFWIFPSAFQYHDVSWKWSAAEWGYGVAHSTYKWSNWYYQFGN